MDTKEQVKDKGGRPTTKDLEGGTAHTGKEARLTAATIQDMADIVLTNMEVEYAKKLQKIWKQKGDFIDQAYKALINGK